jgi:serine/threonine-protein kinase
MFRPVPGAVVSGRYRLQSAIGVGGMGEIWRAHDLELEGPCAVKFILGHLATEEGVRARLLQEGKAAAQLRSAHAVQVLGVGEHEGAMYLAMELLEGEPLSARLARGQLLSPAETLTLLSHVTHTLERAHAAGIVHRDLKPDNLWLCAGHELFVKVLDFGVAKTHLTHSSKHTVAGALVGTPHYMSPEQAMAEREVDHRSDLWALAIITVECLTGRRPFEANGIAPLLLKLVSQAPPPLAQLGAHLPITLESWWQRALQREPERRFQSASELLEALRRGFDASGEVV